MKKAWILLVLFILLLSSCEQKEIINGTPSNDIVEVPGTDMIENNSDNQEVQIDQVIVNITEGDEDNDSLEIDDVLSEPESEAPDSNSKLYVSFIDVGCGDAIFVKTPNNGTMVIDAGDDLSGSKVIKAIRAHDVMYFIDTMIGTNPGSNHIGGLDSIIFNMIQVTEIYDNGVGSDSLSYFQYHEMANNKGMFITPLEDVYVKIGTEDKVKVRIIVPYKDGYSDFGGDNSLVVKMDYGDVSWLFMSDCTTECEKKLEGYDLKADILKIGNYGANSTSDAFIEQVSPKVAILSLDTKDCDYYDLGVVDRLESKGVKVLRTDLDGTISFESDGKSYEITTEKTRGNETDAE